MIPYETSDLFNLRKSVVDPRNNHNKFENSSDYIDSNNIFSS